MVDYDPAKLTQQHVHDIDRLLGYFKQEVDRYLINSTQNPKDGQYAGSLEYLRNQLLTTAATMSGKDSTSIDDLVGGKTHEATSIKTPTQLPAGCGHDEMREDLQALQRNIHTRIIDGYGYLTEHDYDMAGTMFTDVADLQQTVELIQHGEYDRAAQHVYKMDTAVRDDIPSRLYEYLHRS